MYTSLTHAEKEYGVLLVYLVFSTKSKIILHYFNYWLAVTRSRIKNNSLHEPQLKPEPKDSIILINL